MLDRRGESVIRALDLAERRERRMERRGLVGQLTEGQERDALAVRRAASRTTAGTSSTNAATRRLFPIPASPTTTT